MAFSSAFKYFFKYIISNKISVSRSHVMPVKLITFTASLQVTLHPPNFKVLITEDTWQQVWGCHSSWAVTLPHKILAVIGKVSSDGNIDILLWSSWLHK